MTPEKESFIREAKAILNSRDSFLSKHDLYGTLNAYKDSEWGFYCSGVKGGFRFSRDGIPYTTPLSILAEEIIALRTQIEAP